MTENTPTAQDSINWFAIADVRRKIASLPDSVGALLNSTSSERTFSLGRDARVVSPSELPPKPGLSSPAGQARLLHDLASIELQAMELGVRTLAEYPDAPREFREQLAEITLGEGRHLELCLEGLERCGFEWGHWDVHLSLWNAVGPEDSLLDRIMIVHRYLEGSGLDAGHSILRRLTGVGERSTREVVNVIVTEEVDHVLFGSQWFRRICEEQGLNPEFEFASRIGRVSQLIPRRERLARELRQKAGFTPVELDAIERAQRELHQAAFPRRP